MMSIRRIVTRRHIIICASVLAAGIIFACAAIIPKNDLPITEEEAAEELFEASAQDRAEQTMKALAAAYPQIITRAEFRNNDWAILARGTWYYYAESRMLPEALLPKAEEYGRNGFMSSYQAELPPWTEPTAEQAERYRNRGRPRNNNSGNENRPRLLRYQFLQDLLQIHNRAEAESQIEAVKLFEKEISVHSEIIPLLSLIEKRITDTAANDPTVQAWIDNIGEVHGWNWRNVAGSANLSRHSYGIAVDILPKSLNGKETYWQWAAQRGKEWWNIPYTDRYHPPLAVVKAFEAYGFIWGGKWTIFDTMHFEYRPETFILSGLELITIDKQAEEKKSS